MIFRVSRHRGNIHSCGYFFQLSSETWRPWVKQSDQCNKQRQTNDTTPLPPRPKWKIIACWGEVENAIFLQTRKNSTTAPNPPPPKITSPKRSPVQSSPVQSLVQSSPESSPVQSSPVQSRVQSRFSNWQSTLPAFKKAVRQLRF